jgi:hypothetical protein
MAAFDQFHSEKPKMDGLRGMREDVEQGWRAGGRPTLGYKLENQVVGTREGRRNRCSAKSIKAETLEEAVLAVFFEEMPSTENNQELQREIEAERKARSMTNPNIVDQLERELKDIERQVTELVAYSPGQAPEAPDRAHGQPGGRAHSPGGPHR